MAISSRGESYVLGGTDHELERLIRQARIFNPFTERLFRNAGVARGQRVLDIGSGVGDIAMLKRFPTDLNRWDSQEITDGGVFGH
jgi:hypothetical protein